MPEEPVKVVQGPPPVKPMDPSQYFQALAGSLSTGDPSAIGSAMGMTPEQVEQLKESMMKEDMRWAKMGAQLDHVADAIFAVYPYIGKIGEAIDKQTEVFGNMMTQIRREQDLQVRVWKRLYDEFPDIYDEERDKRDAKDAADKAKWEKEHPKVEPKSEGSPKVTTSKPDVKVV